MKYACPQCKTVEELIGANQPYCLGCRVPMIPATQSYQGLWINPDFVLTRMGSVVAAHGSKEAGTGHYKHEREAYASALWALGLAENTGRMYWVEIEIKDQTPDTRVHYLDQIDGANHARTHNVEVVDWTEHVDDPIHVIKAKCAKAYPSYFILLVFGRHGGKRVPVDRLLEDVGKLKVPFCEIWMVGPATESRAIMVQLHPAYTAIEYDVAAARQKMRSWPAFLQLQKRGKGTEFEDLGTCFIPIP